MNVLILSAGRRVELVEEFKEEVRLINDCGKVITADCEPKLSAACHKGDCAVKSPRASSREFRAWLLETCRYHDIKIVVPTTDHDLLPLANLSNELRLMDVQAAVSHPEFIGLCRDKRLTTKIYQVKDIDYPRTLLKTDIQFPVFCKPIDGSSSIGAQVFYSHSDLFEKYKQNDDKFFQEFIGPEYSEFTCDAYFNKNCELKCLVPRERLAVRAGEISKGVTRKNFVYDYLISRIQNLSGALGPITIQVFGNYDTGSVKAIEINPRFAGGYPLTAAAGISYVRLLVREWLLGDDIPFFDSWDNGLLMLRYDSKVLSHVD